MRSLNNQSKKTSKIQILGKILKLSAIVVLSVIICFELTVLITGAIWGEEAVAKLPVYILEVQSDSMYPKISRGNCIFCADVPFEYIGVGDIITFANNGDLVTHEVISINDNETVTTKGLQNAYDDGEIDSEAYVGRVIFKMRFLTMFLTMTESIFGKIVFAAIVLILIFGYPAVTFVVSKILNRKDKH